MILEESCLPVIGMTPVLEVRTTGKIGMQIDTQGKRLSYPISYMKANHFWKYMRRIERDFKI